MNPLVEQLNLVSATGILALQIVLGILLITLFTARRPSSRALLSFTSRYALMGVFALSLTSVVLSLVYSEYLGFVPCGLCWFQRIFLYPLVIISGIALWKQHLAMAADYLIALSIPGLIISLYHHYIQIGGSEVIGCPVSGGDCGQRIIFEFGYITFPLIAATIFAATILFMIIAKRTR